MKSSPAEVRVNLNADYGHPLPVGVSIGQNPPTRCHALLAPDSRGARQCTAVHCGEGKIQELCRIAQPQCSTPITTYSVSWMV